MRTFKTIRTRLIAVSLAAALLALAPAAGMAESKDMIALQAQVAQLIDMVQRLQSTVDSRLGVIQNLVQQSTDNSNRLSAAMDTLQQKIAAQNEALGGKVDAESGQVQSVSDSLDEVKARLDKLQNSLQSLQTQLQNTQQQMQQQPAPGGNGAPAGAPSAPGGNGAAMNSAPMNGSGNGAGNESGNGAPDAGAAGANSAAAAPPLDDTYQSAVRDFDGGHYRAATSEFQEILQYYPQDDKAGAAQYYLGEMAYNQQQYDDAIKSFNVVLESFPHSSKAPTAQLHKAYALLKMNQRSAAIHELRSLISRHPASPEARLARSRLNGMGVRVVAER